MQTPWGAFVELNVLILSNQEKKGVKGRRNKDQRIQKKRLLDMLFPEISF